MTRILTPRKYPWLQAYRWRPAHPWVVAGALLAVTILLAAIILAAAGVWGGSSRDLSAAEVVYNQPLRAGHTMAPVSAPALPAASGQPRAALPVEFFNFSAVGPTAVVRHDFLIVNRGSAPLVIQGAYTTCGCTTAEITASVIPAGKASRATLIFDAGYHAVAGQTVRRGLILETNDPERPQVEIWVQAEVGK